MLAFNQMGDKQMEKVFNENGDRIKSTEMEMKMARFDEAVEACMKTNVEFNCKTYLFCVKHQHEWTAIRYPKSK